MPKLITYVIIITGTLLLLNAAGITTAAGWVLQTLTGIGDVGNFSSTALVVAMGAAILSLIAVSGIRTSFFSTPSNTTFAAAAVALPLSTLVGDMVSVIVSSAEGGVTWVTWIIYLILAPLMIAYLLALFDWARGTDQ